MRRAALALVCLTAACRGGGGNDDGRLSVVASVFPAAEAARAVGGGHVSVTDLTPPDAEAHDLEPDADAVDSIEDADVVVYLGREFQPAVERAVKRADGRRVDLLAGVAGDDPHVWLDPVLMRTATQQVADALATEDPEHAADYRRRAAAFDAELVLLDEEYRTRLQPCPRRTIVTTHDAFGRLAERYGLRQEALTGTSPEAEPDPRRLAELLDLIRREGITTVFTESRDDNPVAEPLTRHPGIRSMVLWTLEQPVVGGYLNGLRHNLTLIVDALGCGR